MPKGAKVDLELTKQGKIKRSTNTIKIEETAEELRYRALKPIKNEHLMKDFASKIKCTRCLKDLTKDISLGKTVPVHPLLKTFFCLPCREYYFTGDFSADDDEDEKYCRWCGDGGDLLYCSRCNCGICEKCVKVNIGLYLYCMESEQSVFILRSNFTKFYRIRNCGTVYYFFFYF